jgi:hypothetical protein
MFKFLSSPIGRPRKAKHCYEANCRHVFSANDKLGKGLGGQRLMIVLYGSGIMPFFSFRHSQIFFEIFSL